MHDGLHCASHHMMGPTWGCVSATQHRSAPRPYPTPAETSTGQGHKAQCAQPMLPRHHVSFTIYSTLRISVTGSCSHCARLRAAGTNIEFGLNRAGDVADTALYRTRTIEGRSFHNNGVRCPPILGRQHAATSQHQESACDAALRRPILSVFLSNAEKKSEAVARNTSSLLCGAPSQ